jgi:periodic tryptophan protein 2
MQVFDPTDLTEDLTPASCRAALRGGSYVRAALIALRLKDSGLLRACVFGTPPEHITTVVPALPAAFAPQLLAALTDYVTESAHLEFVLKVCNGWCNDEKMGGVVNKCCIVSG